VLSEAEHREVNPPFEISGEERGFEIAGVRVRFISERAGDRGLVVPSSYRPFQSQNLHSDLDVHVRCQAELPATQGKLLYDSRMQWRVVARKDTLDFEFLYPPTSRVYCRATVRTDHSEADVIFSESAFREFAPRYPGWELPYPLDQLLIVPVLAKRGVVLLHASGAVLPNGASVFAGHSGDGKTTISGILSKEGVSLLSDERVAIERTPAGFVAHGTPWPGEGEIVSNASAPLRTLFVLEKSESHSIADERLPSLVPELIARAIVPYYLPEIASRILELFADLSTRVPVRKLRFARRGGLKALLQAA
jgi:hypothetical protein